MSCKKTVGCHSESRERALCIHYHDLPPVPYKIIAIYRRLFQRGWFLVQRMDIGWSNFGIQLDLNALMEVNLDTHGDPGSEMLDT